MKFLSKFRVHHTRNDIYDSAVGGILPLPFRLTIKDTLSRRRGLNLRRSAPKPIMPLTYTPPTENPYSPVNKEEIVNSSYPSLNSFPINSEPVSSLPVSDLRESLGLEPRTVKSLQDEILALYFRYYPEHSLFRRYEFNILNKANIMYVFTSLGLDRMVRFSTKDLFLNTSLRGGLHNLLEGVASTSTSANTNFQKVIEFITYFKGMYGRLIILVSFGVGCTVWYTFLPGIPEVAPPEILIPRALPYNSFKDVDFNLATFNKISYVEYRYITDQVLSAFENVYPFTEINLPSINSDSLNPDDGSKARVALGLGIIVAVFLAMGMMSYSSPPELELITTSAGQELIARR